MGALLLPLVETVPIEDEICTDLRLIEDLGFAARFVIVNRQTCYEDGSSFDIVKRKIVMPYAGIVPALEMTAGFMARRTAGTIKKRVLALVR